LENLAEWCSGELDKAIDQLGKDDVLAVRDILGRVLKYYPLPACANSLEKVEAPHIAEHWMPRSVWSKSASS
jgi:hypothetical protein